MRTLLVIAAGFVLVWLVVVLAFYVAGRRAGEPTRLRDGVRLLPDVVRLVRRLAADPSLSRGLRWRLGLLLGYLVLPLDLVPDFIPVAGYADDILIVAWVLRSVVRAAGPEALERHWPGTPEGLAVIRRLAGVHQPITPTGAD
ncbi:MAG: YkvA family protein [Marmoricola sp.]